tara:strand:+ start:63 stop:725 length:663 start_codon:yes stop_codon:yes gene_type:complete
MHQSKSKKILIYFFLFLIIGTLNNKNLKNLNFPTLNNIIVSGLDEKDNLELINKLNFLKVDNLFFLNKSKINEIIDSNNFVEKFSIYKIYPSSIEIEIEKTRLLIKTDNNYYLGSNGKFMKINDQINDIPTIFGNFDVSEFFLLKDIIEKSNFKFENIDKLYFLPSKRWDIETKNGILIKLPKDKLMESFQLLDAFFLKKKNKNFKSIDLRQNKQIIVNE